MTVTVPIVAADGAKSTVTLPAPTVASSGGAGFGQPVMSPPAGYTARQLAFSDTFSGTRLDLTKWTPEGGYSGFILSNRGALPNDAGGRPYTGPNTPTSTEDELFVPTEGQANSTIVVNNGLSLWVRPNSGANLLNPGGIHYQALSGWLDSVIQPGHGPGETANYKLPSTGKWYVQVRCKMPDMVHGCIPGLWFMPASSGGGTELDFIQGGLNPSGSPNANYYPIGAGFAPNADTPSVGFDSTTAFHIYGIELNWATGKVTGYVDGTQIIQFNVGTSAVQYEIILDTMAWLPGLGWAVGYDRATSSAWRIAELQAYAA
jgi:hypothetical protein